MPENFVFLFFLSSSCSSSSLVPERPKLPEPLLAANVLQQEALAANAANGLSEEGGSSRVHRPVELSSFSSSHLDPSHTSANLVMPS